MYLNTPPGKTNKDLKKSKRRTNEVENLTESEGSQWPQYVAGFSGEFFFLIALGAWKR